MLRLSFKPNFIHWMSLLHLSLRMWTITSNHHSKNVTVALLTVTLVLYCMFVQCMCMYMCVHAGAHT